MVKSIIQTDANVIRIALLKSSGICSEIIQSYLNGKTDAQLNWSEFKTLLTRQFGLETDPRGALDILRQTKHERGVSIHNFAKLILIRAKRAFPTSDLDSADIQRQLIEIFIRQVNSDNIRRRVIIKNPATLQEAIEIGFDAEKVNSRMASYGITNREPISSSYGSKHEPMEIDEIRTPASANKNPEENCEKHLADFSNLEPAPELLGSNHYQPYEYENDPAFEEPSYAYALYNSQIRCFHCNKRGHKKVNCYAWQRYTQPRNQPTPHRYQTTPHRYQPAPHNNTQRPRYQPPPQYNRPQQPPRYQSAPQPPFKGASNKQNR